MDEGDRAAVDADARPLVDQLGPTGSETLELGLDVVDLDRKMVHAGAAPVEELPDRRVRRQRGEQLDPAVADLQEGCLDALVRDRPAQDDLGPEEPAPRRHRLVEVGNGDADVVNPIARHAPDATVGAMRRAFWLVLLIVAVTGCGGGGGAKPNGVADLPPTQILAEMKKAVADAKSVHIVGSGKTGGTPIALDLQLASGKGGAGHVEVGGYGFDLVAIGDQLYFKADAKALEHYAGGVVGQLLADKWFQVPATSGGFGSFSSFTNLQELTKQILTASGTVEKGDETTVDGQKAIALTDTGKGGTLYVATTGPAYPLELQAGKNNTGSISFTDWDQPVTLTAPKGAIDYEKLTGG